MSGNKNTKGSAGVLDSLRNSQGKEIEKNAKVVKKEENRKASGNTKEEKMNRTYSLPKETIKKLQELQIYHYDVNTKYSEIVEEAINNLYENKT